MQTLPSVLILYPKIILSARISQAGLLGMSWAWVGAWPGSATKIKPRTWIWRKFMKRFLLALGRGPAVILDLSSCWDPALIPSRRIREAQDGLGWKGPSKVTQCHGQGHFQQPKPHPAWDDTREPHPSPSSLPWDPCHGWMGNSWPGRGGGNREKRRFP